LADEPHQPLIVAWQFQDAFCELSQSNIAAGRFQMRFYHKGSFLPLPVLNIAPLKPKHDVYQILHQQSFLNFRSKRPQVTLLSVGSPLDLPLQLQKFAEGRFLKEPLGYGN
jgi:hypothetical protein